MKASSNAAYKFIDQDNIKRINNINVKEFEKINRKRNYLEKNNTCLLNPKIF